jgi:hypothetical protein
LRVFLQVIAHAACAIINFCHPDYCPPESLQPYAETLLRSLCQLLNIVSTSVKEQTLIAVAAIAKNLGTDFAQYYDIFVPAAKKIVMSCTTKDERRLRGKAFESIALIGQAVGIEKFGADATETLNVLASIQKQGMDSDDPQTRCILQACSRICCVLGMQSLPYLPILIPPLLATVTQKMDFAVDDVEPETEKGMDNSVMHVKGVGTKRVTLNTALVEDKVVALRMLFDYAEKLEVFFVCAD